MYLKMVYYGLKQLNHMMRCIQLRKRSVSLYLTVISFLLGIGSFVLSVIIGSTVDSNGFLHEPFFLIPIGYLFIGIGIVSLVVYIIRNFRNNSRVS